MDEDVIAVVVNVGGFAGAKPGDRIADNGVRVAGVAFADAITPGRVDGVVLGRLLETPPLLKSIPSNMGLVMVLPLTTMPALASMAAEPPWAPPMAMPGFLLP